MFMGRRKSLIAYIIMIGQGNFYTKEGDDKVCAITSLIWAGLFFSLGNIFSVFQQPILQLVDNCKIDYIII
jgi:hypothetical protein